MQSSTEIHIVKTKTIVQVRNLIEFDSPGSIENS